jgi:DNA-binding NarL/FixJ family response regulator
MNQFDTSQDNMLLSNTKKQRRTIPIDTAPVVLHFRPDYESSETHQQVHNKIVKASGCVRIRVKTWREFVDAIRDEQPDFITIHQSVINTNYNSVEDFAIAVQALVQYIPKHRYTETVPVAIGIESDTTQQFVDKLRCAGFAGIWPTATVFGAKKCVEAMQIFLSNQEYWPEDIIGKLPNPKTLPNIVYYNDNHDHSVKCTSQISQVLQATYTLPGTWQELIREIEAGEDKIVFHIDMITRVGCSIGEFVDSIGTITRFMATHNALKIMVLIKPTTTRNQIRELKNAKILGIGFDMNYYSVEQTAEAAHALINNEPYWPDYIIDQLPSTRPVIKSATDSTIKLTVRQQEVMDLICHRGLSNKQIAKKLNLSESTVKIHVSAVMKNYGVRNRTQLALSAGTGLRA